VLGTIVHLPVARVPARATEAVLSDEPVPRGDAVSLELESVRRAASGDARAQAWLARRVVGRVRRVARALARNAADADDAAQLSLIEVLRSAHGYRGEAGLDAWAGRIAARTTLRHLARERRMADSVVAEAPAPSTSTATDELQEALPRDLRCYLDELPEAQRTAIVLHHALGCSLDEVAEMAEVSPNTVKGRLRLGLAALRKLVRRDQAIGHRGGIAS
jgi:RNA polymerase sigma-70 factor (ECF subfamily)